MKAAGYRPLRSVVERENDDEDDDGTLPDHLFSSRPCLSSAFLTLVVLDPLSLLFVSSLTNF